MTQLLLARDGIITKEMKEACLYDTHVNPEFIAKGILEGNIVLPKNKNHKFSALAIGKGLTTKVNANIGSSQNTDNIDDELFKLELALKAGTHSVMDLSTGSN